MLLVQSSGKLEMERGMVKPMIRGEQQDSRSGVLCLCSLRVNASFGLLSLLSAFRACLHFSPNYSVLSGLRT